MMLKIKKIFRREVEIVPFYRSIFITYAIIITLLFVGMRIAFFFFPDGKPLYLLRDVDFRILHVQMNNGLINFYKDVTFRDLTVRSFYLYYWYFLFFPIYLIPVEIGLYVWDALRLCVSIYIAKNISKITTEKKDLIFFYLINGLGFLADSYLNNINWLIQILIFQSYIYLKRDKKWLSGILFALAMFKINLFIYPLILIIVKELKVKKLYYYVIPFVLLCLPYIIFPDYLYQLVYNWTQPPFNETQETILILRIYNILWKAFQPAHLMFLSFIAIIFIVNLKSKKWQNFMRNTIFIFIVILNLSFPFILWI